MRGIFGDASRSHIAAISRGDYAAAVADAQEYVELDVFAPREFSWTARARGREALVAAIEHNVGTVERPAGENRDRSRPG